MAQISASDLIDEIGLLLQSLIVVYIEKHAEGSQTYFLNSFLVFPEYNDFNPSILIEPHNTKAHFDEHVSSELIGVDLVNAYFDDDFVLNFTLELYLLFIDDDCDPVIIDLKNGKLASFNNELEQLLQRFKVDELAKFTKKIRNFRTIRLLKDN